MSRWTIYDKDGNVLHESIEEFDGKGKIVYQDTFEYVGKWMGECYLTISIKSPYPIDFQIGDYIEYRGEKFTINYDPTVIKKARRGTYGEGFVYDSIKFNSYSNELTMMLFHDWVLDDNKVHYTSLPAFSFYAKDVDDLVDRLQACADRWCKDNGRDKSEYWMFYTLANNTQGTKDTGQYQTTYERTVQRAKDISTDSAFLSAVQSEWIKTYGNPSDYRDSRDDERYDRNISVSNNTVWDGLQKVKTEFGLNFIIRGRNVYIGTVGVPTSHLFEYGKGKGLYEVDKTADTDQKVVTRLHAYGSDQNMPTRYYAEVTSEAFSTIKEIKENNPDYSFVRFTLDLPYSSRYFTNAMTKYGSNIYAVGIKVGDILVNARVEGTDNNGNVEIYSECLQSSTDDDDNTDFANFGQFKSAIAVGARIFFTKGVDRSAFPISNIGFEDGVKALPDNMAVNSLMLPGFPLYSLADICKSVYDSASNSTNYYIKKKPSGTDDEYVLFHTESGKHVVSFSDDRHDPYIVSQNAASLGYRDGDISCTESNDDNGLEAVYPSIEKVTVSDAGIGSGDARVDVVDSADTIDDNGVYDKDGVSIPSFHVTLPKLGFDLRQAAKDANNSGEFKLSMKDGFCGGREFTAKVESVDASTGKITLRVQRSYDDSLFLWFPYSYAKSVQAVGPGMTNAYQILPGDHFVLTGINVGDVNYVWTASVRLLRKAIHWLCKNDYTRYVYTPKIDEIFMARQDLEAKGDTSGKTVSIHDTLKEGDVLLFDDDDLLINGSVYIDQLTIKENGNNGIPTYDVTLRNEVNVGTLQRIQNKVDSVANDIRTGNIGGNVGMTPTQVDPLVKAYGAKYFLSKTQDDTAQGLITFAKGLITDMLAKLNRGATFGTDGYKFDEKGNVVVDALSSLAFDEALERGFGVTKNAQGKYTLSVTDLMVWGKAVFNSLEIRKLYAVGGNVYLSGASSKIVRAVPVKKATDTASSTGGDASETWVACAEGDADCEGWKCYTLNDDGTTATQNGWRKYDQAKCQTFDIEAGAHEGVSNTFYWRLVADVSTENETITETRTETYVDDDGVTKTREVTVDLYDGKKFGWVVLSKTDCESATNDAPKAGDTIVLDGHRMFASGDAEGRDQYNDESRTNVMMLETTGTQDGTLPRIVALTGIVDYKHSEDDNHPYSNTVFILSPKEVAFVSSSFKFIGASGDPITLVNFRGNWAKGTEYGYYDQVSHNDSIWTCIVEKGKTTTAEPSDTSTDWRKEISGGKDAVTYGVQVTPYLDPLSSGKTDPGIQIQFTRTTGATVETFTNVTKLGGLTQVYVDGVYHADVTRWINDGNDKIVFSHFPIDNASTDKTLGTASTIGIELLVNSSVVATANYANGKQGADGSAATVYTIETVGNSNNSGTLTDASTILVTLDGNLKLYKTVGSEKTEDSRPPQCWRLTLGGANLDDVPVFENSAGNNIVSYGYSKDYKIDSNGNSAVPGSATISVYKDSSMGELLASLVVPISLNPSAIVDVNSKLGTIETTTASMKNDMNGMQGTIETIKQGQGQISLKVQDLQNGGVDTSKPHTSSQVDFRTLDSDNFYPVMIRFKDDGGVRHTVEINRPLDGTYGSDKDYMTHGNGFSFRLIFSDIANGWGTNEEGQLRIESISQRWTEPTDTPICPKIAQYHPFSFMLVWLRGGSKYDITVDCTDAYISGIWPYMMQVASNPSWVPDAVRFVPDTWTTAQVNAQGENPYNMLRKDGGGYYSDVTNESLYRFGELAAGNTFAIVGQPRDSKVWFLATWHITSVSESKVYVDVSTYGLLWQTQNPLGIRMNGVLGYIKTGASYQKSTWDSQSGFGSSESIDDTAVHANWETTRSILVIGTEQEPTNGVHRARAVLEAVQSCTEGSSVSFYSYTYFDVSPLYGTDGRTNVKPDLLATGIDIKSHKVVATADNFFVRNNRGDITFHIDEYGNIVGEGRASFNGPVTATTFTLSSDNFYVDNSGNFRLKMKYFSVDETGTITAKGGHISFFNFDEEGMASAVVLVSDSSQNKKVQQGLGLSLSNISVSGSGNQRISSVFLGNGRIDSRFAGLDDNHTVYRVGPYPLASTFYNYIKLEKLGNGSDSLENNPEHAALGIETQGDFCLAALGGPSLFTGMCFASNTGGTFTADKMHTFYLCSGGTFTMPSDPPSGMLIVVIQTGSRINFNGNGHRFQSGTYNSLSFTSDSAGQWSLFYYNNGVWYTIYMTR